AGEPSRKHAGAFDVPARPGNGQPLRANAPLQAIEQESIPVLTVNDSTATEILRGARKTPPALQATIDRDLKPSSMAIPGTRIELATAASNVERGRSANVAGLLAGTDPALSMETVLVTAHYDHLGMRDRRVYPGANDNASGTVAVMELARMFTAPAA